MTHNFPSPRPSPQRRGRTVRRLFEKPTTGFVERASEKRSTPDCYSLSPRERVRVRGNAMSILKTFYRILGGVFISSLCCTASKAEPSILFDGVPVELKISEVSERTIRIELAP